MSNIKEKSPVSGGETPGHGIQASGSKEKTSFIGRVIKILSTGHSKEAKVAKVAKKTVYKPEGVKSHKFSAKKYIGGLAKAFRFVLEKLGIKKRVKEDSPELIQELERVIARRHKKAEKRISKLDSKKYRGKGVAKFRKGQGIEDLKEEHQILKASKKGVAQAHVNAKITKDLKPLKSGDDNLWMALSVSKSGELQENSIRPTSDRVLGTYDLNNIYVHIDGKGHISIRCGVVDTKDKAEQFVQAAVWALKRRQGLDLPKIPLRINMHQLNAFGVLHFGERTMIENENKMSRYIEQRIPTVLEEKGVITPSKGPIVAHTNRCVSGWYGVKGEEAKSHKVSVEGMAKQMVWLCQDIEEDKKTERRFSAEEFKLFEAKGGLDRLLEEIKELGADSVKFQDELDRQTGSLRVLLNKIEDCKENCRTAEDEDQILEYKKDLTKLEREYESLLKSSSSGMDTLRVKMGGIENKIEDRRRELKGELRQFSKALYLYDKSLKGSDPKVHAATLIMADQMEMRGELELSKLTPGQMQGVESLFDRMLGCVSEFNCKSGLDRTGFKSALDNAIAQKAGDDQDKLNFILGFAKREASMRRELKSASKGKASFDMKAWLRHNKQYKDIYEFQGRVWSELMAVGREITERSTGVPGFQWHQHVRKKWNPMEQNKHPIPFIPAFVRDGKDWRQMVELNRRQALTPDGNIALSGLSIRRGG